jgi:hypothetical protein
MAVTQKLSTKSALPVIGAAAWCVVAALWAADVVDLTAVKLLLAVALLVTVPLALDLIRWNTLLAQSLKLEARRAMPVTGVVAAVSLTRSPGTLAAALTIPWLLSCVLVSVSGLLELISARPMRIDRFALIVASGYLTFGAGWLVVSRLGAQPLDFPDAIVELTAVHFHVAGFAAVIVACTSGAFARGRVAGRLAVTGAFGVVAAMPIVAAGITYSNDVAAVGSSLVGISLVCVAVAHATLAIRSELRAAVRGLLAVSSLSVLAAMALAVQYTLGLALGIPALRIDQMARTHGILNGIGFVLFSLLAWHLQRRSEPS